MASDVDSVLGKYVSRVGLWMIPDSNGLEMDQQGTQTKTRSRRMSPSCEAK
jgi:hypothetical protein